MTKVVDLGGLTPDVALEILEALPTDEERAYTIWVFGILFASAEIELLARRITGFGKTSRAVIAKTSTPALRELRTFLADRDEFDRLCDKLDMPFRMTHHRVDVIPPIFTDSEADVVDFEAAKSRLRERVDIDGSDET